MSITPTEKLDSTSDIILAAVLHYFNFELDSLGRDNPQKIKFNFLRDERLENILEKFWKQELRVEPITFSNILRKLKNMIRSSF